MLQSKSIGEKITKARKQKGLSQSELAQLVAISSQAVGKWERGESLPNISVLNQLAEILGVDLNYFSDSFQSIVNEVSSTEPTERDKSNRPSEAANGTLWDFSEGNWMNADFSGVTNLTDKFNYSNVQNCLFVGAELRGLQLKNNNFHHCDFSNADVSNARIERSNFSANSFSNCSLQHVEFSGSYVSGSDFTQANFTSLTFGSGGFENNTLTDAVFKQTSFVDTRIKDVIFNGSMENCSFEKCKLTNVTFQDVTLTQTFFKHNRFKGVTFVNCQADRITYEFLKIGKVDLTGITLLV